MALSDLSTTSYGRRLIVSLIDTYAEETPQRIWASVPRNESDLTEGFVDITFREFANAINNAAWWLDSILDSGRGDFETFAYAGPKDIRYPVLAVAAVKVGRKILLPSPFATPEAQEHVLKVTDCKAYLRPTSMATLVQSIVREGSNMKIVTVPELQEWMQPKSQLYPYNKTWEEAMLDPWIVFHTSGTTGLPRPITYTNLMMTSLDIAQTMPDANEETTNTHFSNDRWYTPMPTLHFIGMTVTLQMTVFLGTIVVFGPSTGPATTQTVDLIFQHGNVAGAMLPPSLLEDLCKDQDMLGRVRKLKYVHFAGAPLNKVAGDKISKYVNLMPAIGSTEAGPYFPRVRNDTDWEYYSFRPSMGVVFEQQTKELYELVIHRNKLYERWQQVFYVYPELDRFPTKDLWNRHPVEPDLWAYAGRTDDLVILSHGEDLYASKMEAEITMDPMIRATLLGGEGRPKPFVIIELIEDAEFPATEVAKQALIESLWSAVERANRLCSEYVKIEKSLVLIVNPQKPLARTAKSNVARRESLALYKVEIDAFFLGVVNAQVKKARDYKFSLQDK
ncbi:uncharacterized protein BP5553_04368 [Venustampulla echinocandica]|uniref:AMP-dependent synthetase/ligase domain-containing protein n=1 Tax=Venustampulla echinocandica TaxID=2656787 RepID=A0A370TN45_9HELO|nr:uncharacterized protein BP5553_04368 [Venustampulla echinocandica]RDL36935.1 hypothetical protein BP5553_04368 [Venustampulla echinocandica]